MRVVVVGANGFLGSHLVDRMVRLGHEVTAVDRFSTGTKRFVETPTQTVVTDDPGGPEVAPLLAGVDAVIDVLGASSPLLAATEPDFDERVTLPRVTRLIHACITAGIGHYYFASTGGAIYGDAGTSSNSEDQQPQPLSAYGRAKLAVENLLADARASGMLASTVWRFSNPYGPRQNPDRGQGLIAIALQHSTAHTPLTVMGSGDMVRDYVFVDDAVTRAVAFLGHPTLHSTYNIGRGHGLSVNEVIHTIEDVTGRSLARVEVPVPDGFVQHSVVNIDRLIAEFGPVDLIPLAEGIRRTLHSES